MITLDEINKYQGPFLSRGEDFVYIPPHMALSPFISCYTITFPKKMPDDYMIIPSASSRIILSVSNQHIHSGLNGVNLKPDTAGDYANKMDLLLLIEFRSGCLYPFIHIDQSELVDRSLPLCDINRGLQILLEEKLINAQNITELIHSLDEIFLSFTKLHTPKQHVAGIIDQIIAQNGNIRMKELSHDFFYSEKQIRRLFQTYVGTSPKTFCRITRMNHAVNMIKNNQLYLTDTAISCGYFDQPHFIHDFKLICGVTPKEYCNKMSVFYNDEYKYKV